MGAGARRDRPPFSEWAAKVHPKGAVEHIRSGVSLTPLKRPHPIDHRGCEWLSGCSHDKREGKYRLRHYGPVSANRKSQKARAIPRRNPDAIGQRPPVVGPLARKVEATFWTYGVLRVSSVPAPPTEIVETSPDYFVEQERVKERADRAGLIRREKDDSLYYHKPGK